MASPPPHGLTQTLPSHPTPKLRPSTRRTPPFSSSSQSDSWDSFIDSPSFSFNDPYPLHIPITPLNLIGVPFSWEQTPGIPKNHHRNFKKTEAATRRRLPLPPAGSTAKKWRSQEETISPKKPLTKRDPFFAALIKCSRDDHDDNDDDDDRGANIWKGSLSDRFGIINFYNSCKKTCAVSESIVYVPRASPHYLLRDHHRR